MTMKRSLVIASTLLSGKIRIDRDQPVMEGDGVGFGGEVGEIIRAPGAVVAVDRPDMGFFRFARRENVRAHVVMADDRTRVDFEGVELPNPEQPMRGDGSGRVDG